LQNKAEKISTEEKTQAKFSRFAGKFFELFSFKIHLKKLNGIYNIKNFKINLFLIIIKEKKKLT
jgi:hypothetical protein